MKKVVIGVCNLGYGHINREKQLIELLIKNNYNIIIVTSNSKSFDEYKNIKKINCSVPWIATNNNGIDFKTCIKKHTKTDYFLEFLKMSIEIEKYFRGVPDIVISDYEPNVAQYSYARNIKLINIEQQSKYLYIKESNINDISLIEERSRLMYFFPKSYLRIVSSFFPIEKNINDKFVFVSPIIDVEKFQGVSEEKFGLVYLSPYGDKEYQNLFELIFKMISNVKNIKFKVYSNYKLKNLKSNNLEILEFSKNFKSDLAKCSFVISTSGHQLISECIYLNKPLLLTSFNTYEQNYNKERVKYYNLGTDIVNYDASEIMNFVSNLDFYKANMKTYKEKYFVNDWQKIIINEIEKATENDKD